MISSIITPAGFFVKARGLPSRSGDEAAGTIYHGLTLYTSTGFRIRVGS